MANLNNLTDEELQAELERRAAIKNALPTPLEHPDFSGLTKCVIDGVTDAVKRQYSGQ